MTAKNFYVIIFINNPNPSNPSPELYLNTSAHPNYEDTKTAGRMLSDVIYSNGFNVQVILNGLRDRGTG